MQKSKGIAAPNPFPRSPQLYPAVRQGLMFNVGEEIQQHDPWPIMVGSDVYVFYSYYDGTNIGVSYATCALADYVADPTNLVRHGSWVVPPDPSGLGDIYHTAPCVFQLPDESWIMFTHIYDGVTDRGFANYCSAAEFPNTWHKHGIVLDASGDEAWVHPESFVPPWLSPSGLWECIYATCPSVGYPWVGRRATSQDGYTWTRRGIVFTPSYHPGDFDAIGVHPIGTWNKIGGEWVGTYGGYDNTTWRPGCYVTRDFQRFYRSGNGSIWQPHPAAGFDHGSIEAPSLFVLPSGRIDVLATTSSSFTPSPGTGGGSDYKIAWATLVP